MCLNLVKSRNPRTLKKGMYVYVVKRVEKDNIIRSLYHPNFTWKTMVVRNSELMYFADRNNVRTGFHSFKSKKAAFGERSHFTKDFAAVYLALIPKGAKVYTGTYDVRNMHAVSFASNKIKLIRKVI